MTTPTKKSSFVVPDSLPLPPLSESLQSFTGETTRIPRLEVPSISVSYKDEDDAGRADGEKKGEFVQFDFATKERRALGKEIQVQILHHRQSLSAYSEKDGVTSTMFTPEVSMKAKSLSVFSSQSSGDGKRSTKFLGSGEMKALRVQFPELGYRRILYVLHEGELKSLVIKGASFGKFLDLTKALGGKSSSAQTLTLGTEKGKKGTVTFYAITFTQGEAADAAAVAKVGTQLSEWFAKHDELQEEAQKTRAEEAAVARGDAPTATVVSSTAQTTVGTVSPEDLAAAELFGKKESKPVTEDELTAAGL